MVLLSAKEGTSSESEPCMNRTDRLLAIVLELQAHGKRRAEDLAATFEISKRTVYRDIQALCEAGVPVIAEPGRGYSLVAGYFLPPLRFSVDEAVMLLLGSDVMAQSFDSDYHAAAQAAARKIAGVLPNETRDEVQVLRASIRFISDDTFGASETAERLQQLRGAIAKRRMVRFHYHARHTSHDTAEADVREADPYGLAHYGGQWYLFGHCHRRHDIRNFRLDRMDELTVLDRSFTRPVDLRRPREQARTVVVRALFDWRVARWVHEARSFFTVSEEEQAAGLLVTLHVHREEEVVHWLLGWGANVRVLEPASLAQQIAEAARAILRKYQDAETLLT